MGPDAQRTARTVIGLDQSRRWLYLVVAEGSHHFGKSKGYAEGQVARFMKDLGCNAAMLFDAGSSSVMGPCHIRAEMSAA